jgi:hypothetical protein
MALEDASSQQLQSETKADDLVEVDVQVADEVDFVTYYEQATGRLVVDPEYVVVGRYPELSPSLLIRNSLDRRRSSLGR